MPRGRLPLTGASAGPPIPAHRAVIDGRLLSRCEVLVVLGIVNKGLEELIRHRYGHATWSRITRRAGVDVTTFTHHQRYPDALTYGLVEAASAELGVAPRQLLHDFGVHWVAYTSRESYGELMALAGDTLPEFLANMDRLHALAAAHMPDMHPPSFSVSEVTEGSLRLRYQSARPGLAPMVEGLLAGLGPRFGMRITSAQVQSRAAGGDHDEFLVTFSPA